jgi:cardiolipin synthase C
VPLRRLKYAHRAPARADARRYARYGAAWAACMTLCAGCATLPPGHDYPRPPSPPLTQPPSAKLAEAFGAGEREHPRQSAFRMFGRGTDGLLLRLELIRQARRSLDLEYYIFHGDETGRLVTHELAQAAARGVRVRILVDDAETIAGDEQLFALVGEANVAVRVFNPWRYRGHNRLIRGVEYLFNRERLDYRMHNKLFVADGLAAIIGGRNIGDQYFQVDPDSQFADDDVFTAGPVVGPLATTFEQFWESPLAIPAEAIRSPRATTLAAELTLRARPGAPKTAAAEPTFGEKLASGEPLAGLLSGGPPLAWASAELACDSPDKKAVTRGERAGRLTFTPLANAIRHTQSELTMVSSYLVPTADEMKLLEERRTLGRRVRILTTSLEANNVALAQAGYTHYRVPLLEAGVELYELRALPQNPHGSGEAEKLIHSGNYSLHAKFLVFDEGGLYVGSMNYDQRSRWLNTETGLIISSPELAGQANRRFDAMTQPGNAYRVTLEPSASGRRARLTWTTERSGRTVITHTEPARSVWQRIQLRVLSLLNIDREL